MSFYLSFRDPLVCTREADPGRPGVYPRHEKQGQTVQKQRQIGKVPNRHRLKKESRKEGRDVRNSKKQPSIREDDIIHENE